MDHKEQASSAKNKYADWNTELQSKLREFREEKKSWITEAAALRSAEKEAQVCKYRYHRRQLVYVNIDRHDLLLKENCWQKPPRNSSSCRHRRKRCSTKLTGCGIMNSKLSNTSKCKDYGKWLRLQQSE